MTRKWQHRITLICGMMAILLVTAGGASYMRAAVGLPPGAGLGGGLSATANGVSSSGIRSSDTSLMPGIQEFLAVILPYVALEAAIAFIVAGMTFILGYGSDGAIQRARKIIVWNTAGLFIVILSYTIVAFIIDVVS